MRLDGVEFPVMVPVSDTLPLYRIAAEKLVKSRMRVEKCCKIQAIGWVC